MSKPSPHDCGSADGWQPMETAPLCRPIAIEYMSGSGWRVTGAIWRDSVQLWKTVDGTELETSDIARWHELPKGLGDASVNQNTVIGTLYSVEFLNEETMEEGEDRKPGTYITIRVPDNTNWGPGKVSVRYVGG